MTKAPVTCNKHPWITLLMSFHCWGAKFCVALLGEEYWVPRLGFLQTSSHVSSSPFLCLHLLCIPSLVTNLSYEYNLGQLWVVLADCWVWGWSWRSLAQDPSWTSEDKAPHVLFLISLLFPMSTFWFIYFKKKIPDLQKPVLFRCFLKFLNSSVGFSFNSPQLQHTFHLLW